MPRFEPPTQRQGVDDYFWGRWKIPVGQSVVLRDGVYRLTPTPWLGEIQDLRDGVDYFLGGHVYEVSDAVADQLEADGFEVEYPVSVRGFGLAPFGLEPFGGGGIPPLPGTSAFGVGPFGQTPFGL